MNELANDLRTKRFWRHFTVHTFSAAGFVSAMLSLVTAIFPDLAPGGGVPLVVAVTVVSLAYGGVRSLPAPVGQDYETPNIRVRVIKGDLLQRSGHLVIGMTTTFDTRTPHIISASSLQGQFLHRVYADDVAEFDRELDQALSATAPVGTIEKPGKRVRYPLGTVAVLHHGAPRYSCLAYCEMNAANEARTTVDGIWDSLDSLWRAVSVHANGGTVSVPVIGGGQARLSQVLPAQDAIRFVILSFMLASRAEKVCDGLDVVVRPEVYAKLDRRGLQGFLDSLRTA